MTHFYCELNGGVVGPLSGVELREAALVGVVSPQTQIAASSAGPWTAAKNAHGLFASDETPLPHPPGTYVTRFHVRTGNRASGPFCLHQLIQFAQQGELSGGALLRAEADGEWFPSSNLQLLDFARRPKCDAGLSPPARDRKPLSENRATNQRVGNSRHAAALDPAANERNGIQNSKATDRTAAVVPTGLDRGDRNGVARHSVPPRFEAALAASQSPARTSPSAVGVEAVSDNAASHALLQFAGRTSLRGVQYSLSLAAIGCVLVFSGMLFSLAVATGPNSGRASTWNAYGRQQTAEEHLFRDSAILALLATGSVGLASSPVALLTSCLLLMVIPDSVESKGFLFACVVCLGCLLWMPALLVGFAPAVIPRGAQGAGVGFALAFMFLVLGALASLSLFLAGLGRFLNSREIPRLAWICLGIDIAYFAWLICQWFALGSKEAKDVEWVLLEQAVSFAGLILACGFPAYVIHRTRKHLARSTARAPHSRRPRLATGLASY